MLLKKKKKKLIPNMSECGQSALKDFVTKKIKSPKCNGDDGKCRTSATVKYISQNSYLLRNLNFYKTGLGIHGLGLPFLPRHLVAGEGGTGTPVPALCDPPSAPHPRSHAANADNITPILERKMRTFFVFVFGSKSPANSIS